jgi:hypothetical protein
MRPLPRHRPFGVGHSPPVLSSRLNVLRAASPLHASGREESARRPSPVALQQRRMRSDRESWHPHIQRRLRRAPPLLSAMTVATSSGVAPSAKLAVILFSRSAGHRLIHRHAPWRQSAACRWISFVAVGERRQTFLSRPQALSSPLRVRRPTLGVNVVEVSQARSCVRLRPASVQTSAGELADRLTRSLPFAPARPEATGGYRSAETAMNASQTAPLKQGGDGGHRSPSDPPCQAQRRALREASPSSPRPSQPAAQK